MTPPHRDARKHTWPITERPPVWVTTQTGRHPGREHGYRNSARIRLVEWTDTAGLRYLQERPVMYVEDRTHYVITVTASNRYMVRNKKGEYVTVISPTARDWRALRNSLAALRRDGFTWQGR